MRRLVFSVVALLLATTAFSQTICIDPGHPSEVGSGTKGKKLTELSLAWQLAKRLEKKLLEVGYKVVLTKKSEKEFVTNKARALIANQAGAALSVRLHADAGTGTGFAVYYPDRQGKVDGVTGPAIPLLRKIRPMASTFHRIFASTLRGELKDNGLKPDKATAVGAKHGALKGSIHSTVPVVLVEMCVLQNPKDEAWISQPANQDKMAEALAHATMQAVGKVPRKKRFPLQYGNIRTDGKPL